MFLWTEYVGLSTQPIDSTLNAQRKQQLQTQTEERQQRFEVLLLQDRSGICVHPFVAIPYALTLYQRY